jgi:hypothetical protein
MNPWLIFITGMLIGGAIFALGYYITPNPVSPSKLTHTLYTEV